MYLATFSGQNFYQFIIVLVLFVGILIVTYFATKWIAGHQKASYFNRNFEVIETMKVTNNKYLQIVRIGREEYFVIGIGKDEIHLITKLSKEQIIEGSDRENKGGFSSVLASFKDNLVRTQSEDDNDDKDTEDD